MTTREWLPLVIVAIATIFIVVLAIKDRNRYAEPVAPPKHRRGKDSIIKSDLLKVNDSIFEGSFSYDEIEYYCNNSKEFVS